jgi:D,D-heptose 1,7-bisphosphate phosphatase
MSSPAVFFDRDNTLIVSDGYLGDPAGVVLVKGAAQAIARVRELGYRVVIISNQSGVARGMFGEDAVESVNQRMEELLEQSDRGALIDRHEFCPFHPQATVEKYRQDSDLRKPRPGMILRAARALNLDLGSSWVVGDAPRDIEAGIAAGCRTIWVADPSLAPSPAALQKSSVRADAVVASLGEAAEVIASAKNQSR